MWHVLGELVVAFPLHVRGWDEKSCPAGQPCSLLPTPASFCLPRTTVPAQPCSIRPLSPDSEQRLCHGLVGGRRGSGTEPVSNGLVSFCFSCVGVEEEEAPDIDIYHCPNCERTHGKSTRECRCRPASAAQSAGSAPGLSLGPRLMGLG